MGMMALCDCSQQKQKLLPDMFECFKQLHGLRIAWFSSFQECSGFVGAQPHAMKRVALRHWFVLLNHVFFNYPKGCLVSIERLELLSNYS